MDTGGVQVVVVQEEAQGIENQMANVLAGEIVNKRHPNPLFKPDWLRQPA